MKDDTLRISAVGDICPGDKYIMGLGTLSKTLKSGANYPFLEVGSLFRGSHIVIGNLEGLLTKRVRSDERDQLTFCGLPEFAQSLSSMGFNVLNVANNHVLDHGEIIFLETLEHLKNANIHVCGLKDDGESQYYSRPVILERKGKSIGILGYNWIGRKHLDRVDKYIARSHDSIVNYTSRRNLPRPELKESNRNVIRDITSLRKHVDILILSAHWGYEFVHVPPFGVTREAKLFIDSGVDIIIGSHPHVVQGVENYSNGLIFYSLGDFLFDGRIDRIRKAAVLNLTFGSRQVGYSFSPMIRTKKLRIRHANTRERAEIIDIIETSSRETSSERTAVTLDDDVIYGKYLKMYRKYRFLSTIKHFCAIFERPRVIQLIFTKVVNNLRKILSSQPLSC